MFKKGDVVVRVHNSTFRSDLIVGDRYQVVSLEANDSMTVKSKGGHLHDLCNPIYFELDKNTVVHNILKEL